MRMQIEFRNRPQTLRLQGMPPALHADPSLQRRVEWEFPACRITMTYGRELWTPSPFQGGGWGRFRVCGRHPCCISLRIPLHPHFFRVFRVFRGSHLFVFPGTYSESS